MHKNRQNAYKKEQTGAYGKNRRNGLKKNLQKNEQIKERLSKQKKENLTYGHKKRSSAELQPLLTLNLIL